MEVESDWPLRRLSYYFIDGFGIWLFCLNLIYNMGFFYTTGSI
jgi:hypothetical protein